MDYEKLVEAIETHSSMGREEIVSAGQHGADAGWAGFTYTVDGADFYREHSALVDELLQDAADDQGLTVSALVASFVRSDMAETRDGHDCLLAWCALEEAGRWLADNDDQPTDEDA